MKHTLAVVAVATLLPFTSLVFAQDMGKLVDSVERTRRPNRSIPRRCQRLSAQRASM